MSGSFENILDKPILKQEAGVIFINNPVEAFEKLYLDVRRAEGWFYEEREIINLPDVKIDDLHKPLWDIRKKSADDFIKYISEMKNMNSLLDIGCGNGWLTNKVAKAKPGALVAGIDIIATELQLAAKVFQKEGINWICGDVMKDIFRKESFDIILLGAPLNIFLISGN
ncbi:MAG: class I SAM-dependent methyltransferase [Chitinophagales bacterium]